MMDGFLIGLVVACAVILVLFIYVAARLSSLEGRLEREIDRRRELGDRFDALFFDAHAAFRALGLSKTPRKDPEWAKADPQ